MGFCRRGSLFQENRKPSSPTACGNYRKKREKNKGEMRKVIEKVPIFKQGRKDDSAVINPYHCCEGPALGFRASEVPSSGLHSQLYPCT